MSHDRFRFILLRDDERYGTSRFPPEIILENCTHLQAENLRSALDFAESSDCKDLYRYYEPDKVAIPIIPELLNFVGLWRLASGGFAKVLSFDDSTKQWTALLYSESGEDAGTIFYDMYGNTEDGNPHLTLMEKRRGDEIKGWPGKLI